MAKPSVRKHPDGGWVVTCVPPCRAQARAATWAEAVRHAMVWAAGSHGVRRG